MRKAKFTYILSVFIILNGSEATERIYNESTTSKIKFINNVDAFTGTSSTISGKWQVGRVSRKQYEIINMLHRKTKTFVELETTSLAELLKISKHRKLFDKNHRPTESPMQESFQIIHPRSNDRPCTPSYIEFYYLDESDDRIKNKDSILRSSHSEIQNDGYKRAMLRPPFFLFRVNDATCKPMERNDIISSFVNTKRSSTYNIKSTDIFRTGIKKGKSHDLLQRVLETKYVPDIYKIKSSNNETDMHHKTRNIDSKNLSTVIKGHFTPNVLTTAYDRIKFFEIYDSDTHKPLILVDHKMNMIRNNYIRNEEKIYLDHVDHDTDNHDGHNSTRFVKKHVNNNLIENSNINPSERDVNANKKSSKSESIAKKIFTKYSRMAKWSEFPFVAVYVYEPTQVRCDSASISPHWLVASATCLYRHLKNHKSHGRSAFVAYCGDNWRMPGRIGYVKRSFIHPRFKLQEKSKRYLYNIGVIQVVNSMANTCNGWQPVSLMSHQFAADHDGSFAAAIGWGLDRYNTLNSASDLPTYPLMMYEGLVYSDSCPGNVEYGKAKTLNKQSVRNVYCLSLPTYTLEENDTVHGGLLLIGGKLIALYLQEERRPWGEQSAQYTGIWRLIPWLLDVAREEDIDSFATEI